MKPSYTQQLASKPTLAGEAFLLTVALLMAGCTANPLLPAEPTSGATAVPAPAMDTGTITADAALLATIAGMPGTRTTFDGRALEAGEPYTAASGCECRYVRLYEQNGEAGASRLACRDGEQQFFAADVFFTPPALKRQP